MSSTNKTANLGLNQWEDTDPVAREDFNADNAAIDTAVGRKTEFVKIRTASISASGKTQVDLDVSDINFLDWQYVMIDVTISPECKMKVNNFTRCACVMPGGSSQSDYMSMVYSGTRLIFSPGGMSRKIMVLGYGPELIYYGRCDDYYGQLKSVNFFVDSSSKFSGTAKFVIWGLK